MDLQVRPRNKQREEHKRLARCFSTNDAKMAILSNGWAQHFRSIVGNDDANKNMKAFTDAFAPAMTLAKRVKALVKEVDAGRKA